MSDVPRPEFRWPGMRRGGAPAAPLPAPEDVFLAWLLALPDGADIAAAARREVARLDASGQRGAGPTRLRALFLEAAEAA